MKEIAKIFGIILFDSKDVEKIICKHNAEILNEFQLQGKSDMPMIAYDERVCLVPAMEIATNTTFRKLK